MDKMTLKERIRHEWNDIKWLVMIIMSLYAYILKLLYVG